MMSTLPTGPQLILLLLGATLLLSACGGGVQPPEAGAGDAGVVTPPAATPPVATPPAPEAGAPAELRVEGRITDEGVECPALRSADNTLYTLAGAPDWVRPGLQVVVTGTVAEMSFCQQGTTLSVKSVERRG